MFREEEVSLNPFTLFLGPSPDEEIIKSLHALSAEVVLCTGYAYKTNCDDLERIIKFEHEGDRLKGEVFRQLNSAFILVHLNKSEVRRFTGELDKILNGMRAVALHVKIWEKHIGELPENALELLKLISEMAVEVRNLVSMLSRGKIDFVAVEQIRESLDEGETKADDIRFKAENKLADEAKPDDAIRVAALIKLYGILEDITDRASHCGAEFMHIAERRG
jgi:uncharacterized protein Yka (UPF0111/DUF47 family)